MTINTTNNNITFKGENLTIEGAAIKVGDSLPSFKLTGQDMADLCSSDFAGKPIILSCVPSLDTPTCSIQTKKFFSDANKYGDKISLLTVSRDLPFAQKRWCGAEDSEGAVTGSDYKDHSFGKSFGAEIKEWGLLARAVFVADARGKVIHVEYVSDISAEPNYQSALDKAATLI